MAHVGFVGVGVVLGAALCGQQAILLGRRVRCEAVQVGNLIEDRAAAAADCLARRAAVRGPAAAQKEMRS